MRRRLALLCLGVASVFDELGRVLMPAQHPAFSSNRELDDARSG